MTITEMVRSLVKNVFLPLVALCMVVVFSFVSFADEATTDKPVRENPAAGPDDSAQPGKIERAGQATGSGVERGGKATGRGVKRAGKATGSGIERAGKATSRGLNRAANATERGLRRAGKATGKGIKKGGEAVEKTFSGTDSAKEQPQQQ
jgi:hypothetical protein